jgi:hypothetical protein
MTREQIDELAERDGVALVLADGFDRAFLGYIDGDDEDVPPRAVYSKAKCIEVLVEDGMPREVAVEFLEFNVWGAYVGAETPIWVNDR